MIKKEDIRIGNVLKQDSQVIIIDEDILEVLMAVRNYDNFYELNLTKDILRDNFGFAIHDMGDFWQCEFEEFVLIQPKFQLKPGHEMPFVLGLKTTVPKSISIKEVHHLQNVYYFIEQKELIYKVTKR